MSNNVKQTVSLRIERLSALTDEMLALAAKNDWAGVRGLDRERRHLVKQLFAQPLSTELVAQLGTTLTRVVAANDTLVARAKRHQGVLRDELQTLGAGRRGVAAYNRVSDQAS